MQKISAENPNFTEEVVRYNQKFLSRLLEFLANDTNSKITRAGGKVNHAALIYELNDLDRDGNLQLNLTRSGHLGAEQGDNVVVMDSGVHEIKPANCTLASFGERLSLVDCLLLSDKPKNGDEVHQFRSTSVPRVKYTVLNGGNLIEHEIERPGGNFTWRYHYAGKFGVDLNTIHTYLNCSKPIRRDGNSRERKPLLKKILEPQLARVFGGNISFMESVG